MTSYAIIVIIVLLVIIIGLLTYNYYQMKKISQKIVWADNELDRGMDLVREEINPTQFNHKFPNSFVSCVLQSIASMYTFEDFVNKKREALTNGLKSCAGKKGNWNPAFKSTIVSQLEKLPGGCRDCLVKNMEEQYEPVDFFQNFIRNVSSLMENACKGQCHK